MEQKVSTKLTKLFPSDVINIILLYTCNKLIIQLQDYFMQPLKYITVSDPELKLINKHNYQYIRKLNCNYNFPNISDEDLQYLSNRVELNCGDYSDVTDVGILYLVNLTKLNCAHTLKITNNSIRRLINLTKLECRHCSNITDDSIKNLVNLTKLVCWSCHGITDNSIW